MLLCSSAFLFAFKVQPVKAGGTFIEDFEYWNDNGWVVTQNGGSTVTISADAKYTGVYGCKFTHVSGDNSKTMRIYNSAIGTWADNEPFFVDFMYYLASGSIGTADESAVVYVQSAIVILHVKNDSGTLKFELMGNSFGTLLIDALTVAQSQWYHIHISYVKSINGYLRFSVDGVLLYDSGEVDTQYDNYIDRIVFGYNTGKYGVGNTETYYIDDILISSGSVNLTADLEPMSGEGASWVFVDWRYYTFTATISGLYSGAIDQCYLSFNVPTGNGSVLCAPYTNNNGNFSLLSNASSTSADRGLDPVRIADGSITTSASDTIIAYKIWFTSKCLDVYSETAGVTVGIVWNDTSGVNSSWYYFPNFFRIYNKGGFSLHYDFDNNAGVLPGGRDFSMFAYNNSYAFKDLVWRDLQHVKLLPTVNFRAGAQTFQVYYGMDYVLADGSWVTGLQARLEVSYVSYTGVFAGNVWINMSCSWYDNNALIKTDDLYMFYHGEVYNYPDPGRWQFWVDLWFDSGNASALQGGRINAYEFPMQDSSAAWLRWLSSNWGVKDNVLKQSECFVPLHDSDGNPLISTEQIKFVRIYSSLNVIPYTFNQYVAITDFSTFDTTLSSKYPLQGIQTPPWDETKMPTVGNTGLLGAVWSMFAGIGRWLSDNIIFGGLALWPTFVAFLDVIAGWLGMPHGFSNMITWLGTGWGWVVSSFTYGITVIYNIFLLLGSILGTLLSVLGSAIVSFVSVIGMITGFITGGFSTGASLWDQLGLTTWLTLGIILYPIYLVFLWDAKGMDAVISQLSMIWGILSWLAHFFMDVVRTIITMISGIIESVPVVE
jgi:hypothetical protein